MKRKMIIFFMFLVVIILFSFLVINIVNAALEAAKVMKGL